MNRKQRRRKKKLQGKNGGKKGANPYFVASGGFKLDFGHEAPPMLIYDELRRARRGL